MTSKKTRDALRRTTPDENLDAAFDLLMQVAKEPSRYPEGFVAIPLDLVPHLFSERRIALLKTLRAEGPFESVQALAEAVDRDVTAVSRDIQELTAAGLAETIREGKTKRVVARPGPIFVA